ncbi:MAG: hypothetical protein QW478_11250 [Candidatus Micrarchaeaceae archaeon]
MSENNINENQKFEFYASPDHITAVNSIEWSQLLGYDITQPLKLENYFAKNDYAELALDLKQYLQIIKALRALNIYEVNIETSTDSLILSSHDKEDIKFRLEVSEYYTKYKQTKVLISPKYLPTKFFKDYDKELTIGIISPEFPLGINYAGKICLVAPRLY